MRVTILGGTGFVGSYIVEQLLEHGHEPVCLVRRGSENKVEQPERCWLVPGDIDDADAVREAVKDSEAVIYNIGIIREFPQDGITFHSLHFDSAKRAMNIAEADGVKRFLLMSANGVKADGTGYQRTKYMAEEVLRSTSFDWTVFRPSLIFGDPRGKAEFAKQLYQDVIRSPLPAPLFYEGLLPLDAGSFQMSPIHVRDLATAVVKALTMPETSGKIYPLCGPRTVDWREVIRIVAGAAGVSKSVVPVPVWAVNTVATFFDRFAFFPITRDQLSMLTQGNTCDSTAVFEALGIKAPIAFDEESLQYVTH
ncbi:MAG: NAD(P)H-binding protein [Gammaproteobacteria bacterium]|nr:NAD(P)H-binding protein [Gammaproteobacteria bacterium]MDH3467008.1 NAD(P)H-binding protein [Gammaproteobacteria bacterium]